MVWKLLIDKQAGRMTIEEGNGTIRQEQQLIDISPLKHYYVQLTLYILALCLYRINLQACIVQ